MTPEELTQAAEREATASTVHDHVVGVCTSTACLASHSDKLKKEFDAAVKAKGLKNVRVKAVGCCGLCASGPMVYVESKASGSSEAATRTYANVASEHVPAVVESLGAAPVAALACDTTQPFFTRQHKIVLESSGVVDPERIEDSFVVGGYQALLKALTTMTPEEVVEAITRSGLRGRGGGGFPTGLKWSTVSKAVGDRKYVICNGDEGDPGAFMDRSVMESDPHRVLEGMAIAGYAVGATEGYLYVRAEYPLAVKRLKLAIKQAERAGLLGANIGGTFFSFKVDVRLGAGAFVCGEETALIASIEGRRGSPRPRPPYPAASGLWGFPTLINNVETFANIAPIVKNGAAWYAALGSGKSQGTKVFALTGKVLNTGLIEVPMGITLREIVYDIGGGPLPGHTIKAVQTGGPSGGCIPEAYLDQPVEYETLVKLGSIMGSGGLIAMDDTSCMVDVARYFMEFCMTESCGKCVPCRVGTVEMHALLTKICEGQATMTDLEQLEELCEVVKSTSLCGLGQTAPSPVISTLRYFRDEYIAHIEHKTCPAGVCSGLKSGAVKAQEVLA